MLDPFFKIRPLHWISVARRFTCDTRSEKRASGAILAPGSIWLGGYCKDVWGRASRSSLRGSVRGRRSKRTRSGADATTTVGKFMCARVACAALWCPGTDRGSLSCCERATEAAVAAAARHHHSSNAVAVLCPYAVRVECRPTVSRSLSVPYGVSHSRSLSPRTIIITFHKKNEK